MKKHIRTVALSCILLLGSLAALPGMPIAVFESYAAESSFDITNVAQPILLEKGESFTFDGKVKSNTVMNRIEFGIVKGADYVKGHHITTKINAKEYQVPQLNTADLPVGSYYYRIWTHDQNGAHRILNKYFRVTNTSVFAVSTINCPVAIEVGENFESKGFVTSDLRMKNIEIGIACNDAKWEQHMSEKIQGRAYNIEPLASKLDFSKLKPGTYWYRIWVGDANGAHRVLNQKFTVANTSFFDISTLNVPPALKAGQGFSLKGTIYSAYNMSRIEIGIVQGSNYVKGQHFDVSPNSRQYALPPAAVTFSKLPAGTYYYRVWAHDKNGAHKIIDKPFTVSSPTPSSTVYRDNFMKVVKSQVGKKQGDPSAPYATGAWCAKFVQWCAVKANVPTKYIPHSGCDYIPTLQQWAYQRGKYKHVYYKTSASLNWNGQPSGAVVSYTPKAGDLVIIDHSGLGRRMHVAVVNYVEKGILHTIGGNESNGTGIYAVRDTGSFNLKSNKITGYIVGF